MGVVGAQQRKPYLEHLRQVLKFQIVPYTSDLINKYMASVVRLANAEEKELIHDQFAGDYIKIIGKKEIPCVYAPIQFSLYEDEGSQ